MKTIKLVWTLTDWNDNWFCKEIISACDRNAKLFEIISFRSIKMSQIDREELSKMLDQFKKGKKSNFGLR